MSWSKSLVLYRESRLEGKEAMVTKCYLFHRKKEKLKFPYPGNQKFSIISVTSSPGPELAESPNGPSFIQRFRKKRKPVGFEATP
jgi:hypothetical protein